MALLLAGALALLVGCAGSATHLIGAARAPISPGEVKIYRTPPRHYEQIALIDSTSGAHLFHGTEQGEAEAVTRLKEEAAKLGANGVLLTLIADRPTGVIGVGVGGGDVSYHSHGGTAVGGSASGAAPVVQNSAQGIAIYVPKEG